jgi:hypothetical protein
MKNMKKETNPHLSTFLTESRERYYNHLKESAPTMDKFEVAAALNKLDAELLLAINFTLTLAEGALPKESIIEIDENTADRFSHQLSMLGDGELLKSDGAYFLRTTRILKKEIERLSQARTAITNLRVRQ